MIPAPGQSLPERREKKRRPSAPYSAEISRGFWRPLPYRRCDTREFGMRPAGVSGPATARRSAYSSAPDGQPPPTRSRSSIEKPGARRPRQSWQSRQGDQFKRLDVHGVLFRRMLVSFLEARSAACTERTLKVSRGSGNPSLPEFAFAATQGRIEGPPSCRRNSIGSSMDEFDAQLDDLKRSCAEHCSSARRLACVPRRLAKRLRAIPFSVDPWRRVALLIDAASQYYLHGQKVFNAVEPIALATMLAEQNGEQSLLRRALSIQGLILTATRNTPDALRSLLHALDIAEALDDRYGSADVWVNIAVTFFEATLYNDARVCFARANAMAAAASEESRSAKLRAKALHGASLCGLYLHEYLQGVDACKEALWLLREPSDREEEQVRALVEATYVQLLLALNRSRRGGRACCIGP